MYVCVYIYIQYVYMYIYILYMYICICMYEPKKHWKNMYRMLMLQSSCLTAMFANMLHTFWSKPSQNSTDTKRNRKVKLWKVSVSLATTAIKHISLIPKISTVKVSNPSGAGVGLVWPSKDSFCQGYNIKASLK